MKKPPENRWGERDYISQVEPPYSQMPFGDATIREYGCGACSTANVVLHMGGTLSFADVVSYYTQRGQPLHVFANTFGIMPWEIYRFFHRGQHLWGLNTTASLEWGARGFQSLLERFRYVITAVRWKGGGAHYIACMKNDRDGVFVLDPGNRYGEMQRKFSHIDQYLTQNGGGYVIGAIGINVMNGERREH